MFQELSVFTTVSATTDTADRRHDSMHKSEHAFVLLSQAADGGNTCDA